MSGAHKLAVALAARPDSRCMVGGMIYQNPPPHPPDSTAPDAPRISRRTAKVLGLLVRLAWTSLIIYLTLSVFAPWFAGLLNIHRIIVVMAITAVVLIGVLMIASPSITRRVRARSAPVLRDQA